jgi:hypothetical protein
MQKKWCDACQKVTTRYKHSDTCRSCASRKAGLASFAKHGNPGTPESRRRGTLARNAKHGNPAKHMTPEQLSRAGAAGGYRSGRVRLGHSIERRHALMPLLEAKLAAHTLRYIELLEAEAARPSDSRTR